jgi:L-fuconolactonase
MRIDSHQHFWNYSAADYPWIPPGSVLERSYLPHDLEPQLKAAKLDKCIAVQARQSLEENDFLCSLASRGNMICGVVGWIDLRSPDVASQADHFSKLAKAVGVRHVVQAETDPNFMQGTDFRRGIASLKATQLVYDILIVEHQLDDAIRLVRDFPEQAFVLDHIAKPKIEAGELSPWQSKMVELSHYSNVTVKLSGMLNEAGFLNWTVEQLFPYWEITAQAFGLDRIMFGSDWPVIRMAGEYSRWVEIVEQWLEPYTAQEKASVWGGNAQRVYLSKSSDVTK